MFLVVLSAYAIYDLNDGSLDFRDREVRLIVTGSMDGNPTNYHIPTIPINSLIMIRHIGNVDDFVFEIGQVIAYDNDGKIITHRIIAIDEDRRTLHLKGDANKTFEFVSYDDVVGEVVGVSEILGKIMTIMRSNIVLALAFIICSIAMAFSIHELILLRREKRAE